jgi:IMP dehydrogenase
VPVVDGGQLVGIVTSRDMRFEKKLDDPVRHIMTKKDAGHGARGRQRRRSAELMHQHRIEKVLVVNDEFALRGLITVKDIQKARDNPNAAKDAEERCWSAPRSASAATPRRASRRWSRPAST